MHPGSRSESDADRGRRGVRSRAGRARRGYSVCDEAHSQRGRSCCSPYSGVRDTSCSRLLVGTAVKAHPLGVVLALATGFLLVVFREPSSLYLRGLRLMSLLFTLSAAPGRTMSVCVSHPGSPCGARSPVNPL